MIHRTRLKILKSVHFHSDLESQVKSKGVTGTEVTSVNERTLVCYRTFQYVQQCHRSTGSIVCSKCCSFFHLVKAIEKKIAVDFVLKCVSMLCL